MYNLSLIGVKIKLKRRELKMTQIEFADSLGVSQGTLSEVESGKTKPSFEMLLTLADRYDVDLNWLLVNRYNDLDSRFREDEISLLNHYRKLEVVAQEEVLDYIKMKLVRYSRK